MAAFTSKDVMDLRARTGAGMMDCKKALTEADGDMDKAVTILREKGAATAAKKAGRVAAEGIVESYIHMGGKIGVLVEVNCETDFVAKSDDFKNFAHDVALQIASMKPTCVAIEDLDAKAVELEREIYKNQALAEPKPKPLNIIEKMVDGRIQKYYKEVCLLEQDFFKDPGKTIKQYQTEVTAKVGEKVAIRRFVRYEMGEGIEKRKDDYLGEISENREMLAKVAFHRLYMQNEQAKPNELIFIGDTPNDVRCANAIGAPCLIILEGSGYKPEDFAEVKPWKIIDCLPDDPKQMELLLDEAESYAGGQNA